MTRHFREWRKSGGGLVRYPREYQEEGEEGGQQTDDRQQPGVAIHTGGSLSECGGSTPPSTGHISGFDSLAPIPLPIFCCGERRSDRGMGTRE
jgi:hypothetical protein